MPEQKLDGRGTSKNGHCLLDDVKSKLIELDLTPSESIGQNFLVDQEVVEQLVGSTDPNSNILEIGPGLGQITQALAERHKKVVAVEIDRRFKPVLEELVNEFPHLSVIYGDIIALGLDKLIKSLTQRDAGVEVVSNLPFHITEPFMQQIIRVPMEGISLIVGKRFADAIQASSEGSVHFGQLTMLAQSFFHCNVIRSIGKDHFYPKSGTDAVALRLTPRDLSEFYEDRRGFLTRRLILTSPKNPLVKNCLKEGLIEYHEVINHGTLTKEESHQRARSSVKRQLKDTIMQYNYSGDIEADELIQRRQSIMSQNEARGIILEMGVATDILNKPFQQLNNSQLRSLSACLV